MDNYLMLIIIGAILVVMAVIGYIAEKTNFGTKVIAKGKMPVKKEKAPVEKEKIELEPKGIGEMSQSIIDNIQQDIPVQSDIVTQAMNSMPILNEEPIFEPVKKEVEDNTPIDQSLFEPINFDSNENNETSEEIDQSLFEPLPGDIETEENTVENNELIENAEVVSNDETVENVENNETNENTESEVQSDDDIWKF